MFTDVPAQTKKMVCWDCGEEISPTDIQCPHCHADLQEKTEPRETDRSAAQEQHQPGFETAGQERYPVLKMISKVYQVIGVLSGVIAFIAAVIEFVTLSSFGKYGTMGGLVYGFGIMIAGALAVISCFAIAEGINVFLDIEENTRKAAQAVNN